MLQRCLSAGHSESALQALTLHSFMNGMIEFWQTMWLGHWPVLLQNSAAATVRGPAISRSRMTTAHVRASAVPQEAYPWLLFMTGSSFIAADPLPRRSLFAATRCLQRC